MNPYLTLLIFITAFYIIIKLLSYKARTGRLYPEVDAKKATYMFVFFAWIGFVVIIIYLAWIR